MSVATVRGHSAPMGLALLSMLALSACSNKTLYEQEDFSRKSVYTHQFDAPPEVVIRACRNAAQQRHYAIQSEDANHSSIKVIKINQLDDDRYAGLAIEAGASPVSPTTSILRTVAYERQYEITKNHEVAHIQAFIVTIPLPTGEKQSVTEVSNETVEKPEFYAKLYAAVGEELEQARTELKLERSSREKAEADHIRMEESVRRDVRAGVPPSSEPAPEPLPSVEDNFRGVLVESGSAATETRQPSTPPLPAARDF